MTDEKLYFLCKKYGNSAKFWRQKFIGLLPEVNRRKLYARKGFSSIFEFAFKLGGLSAEQVRLALNLEKRFENKPILQKLLIKGEASINKLSRVVSIATPENEAELAEKIKLLPQKALETLVRDEKILARNSQNPTFATESQNGLQISFFENKSLRAQTLNGEESQAEATQVKISEAEAKSHPHGGLNFQLDKDVTVELNQLHKKGFNVSALLRELLEKRKQNIEDVKEKMSAEIDRNSSRYIPVKIRNILKQEHGEKCSITSCKKPANTIHHTQRFSLSSNHDPKYLAPLCKEHHTIAHSIDLKFQQKMKAFANTE